MWVELGLTLLIIEHDIPLIMGISDRIVAMADGQVIATGTPGEVRTNPSDVPAAGVVGSDASAPVGSLGVGPAPAPVLGPSLAPAPAAVAAPQVAPAPSANQTVRSQPAGTLAPDLGFQYPEVLLLPLAFMVGLVFLVRTFTSDATPRNVSR